MLGDDGLGLKSLAFSVSGVGDGVAGCFFAIEPSAGGVRADIGRCGS